MNSTPERLRKAVWHNLLTAELNTRYWRRLGHRYSRRDMVAKIFLGVTASSTVASWGIWQEVELLWKALSAVSAVLAIALPIVDWPKVARKMTALSAKWQSLQASYELAWIDVEDGAVDREEVRAELQRLKKLETDLAAETGAVPEDSKLKDEIYAAVRRSRGI